MAGTDRKKKPRARERKASRYQVTNLKRCEQPGPTFGTPYCLCKFCLADSPEYRGYER